MKGWSSHSRRPLSQGGATASGNHSGYTVSCEDGGWLLEVQAEAEAEAEAEVVVVVVVVVLDGLRQKKSIRLQQLAGASSRRA